MITPELVLKQILFVSMKARPRRFPINLYKRAIFDVNSTGSYFPTCQNRARVSNAVKIPLKRMAFNDLGFLKRYWQFL